MPEGLAHQTRLESAAGRDLIVYLPPGYDEGRTRYPVLYLHDGQNLFDPATAFLGQSWGLGDLADELIARGEVEPFIIVGIYNLGADRLREYTPVADSLGQGGGAVEYGNLITREVKPFIDRRYRTLRGGADTGLGGSSLGALVTLFLGLRQPQVFGKLIVMSPSVWWAGRAILQHIRTRRLRRRAKIWLDTGTCEGSNSRECVENVDLLRQALVKKGWQTGRDLMYVEDEGAGHNEKAWGSRMRQALVYLFPPRSPAG